MSDPHINPAKNGNTIACLAQCLHNVIGNMKVVPRAVEMVVHEEMFRNFIQKHSRKQISHSSFKELLETPLLDGIGISIEELRAARNGIDEIIRLAIGNSAHSSPFLEMNSQGGEK